MNPDLTDSATWTDLGQITWLLGMYFVSGSILEILYRWFAWGEILPRQSRSAVIRPECPEHPWISLLDRQPESGSEVELFCADGKVRIGVGLRRDDGTFGIAVSYPVEDAENISRKVFAYRPTHWRALQQDMNRKEHNE
jgi:hypothetical protein